MKKALLYFITIPAFFASPILLISQSVINGASGQGSLNQTSIEWCLGEFAISTNSNTSTTISEGFLQPEGSGIIHTDYLTIEQDINIYPNPTHGYAKVNVNSKSGGNFEAFLTNSLGVVVLKDLNFGHYLEVDLTQFPSGIYFLSIYNNQNSKTYKILKQ